MNINDQKRKASFFLKKLLSILIHDSKEKELVTNNNLPKETFNEIRYKIKEMYRCGCNYCGDTHYNISDGEIYSLTPKSIPGGCAILLLEYSDHHGNVGFQHIFAVPFGIHEICVNVYDHPSGYDEKIVLDQNESKGSFEFLSGSVHLISYYDYGSYYELELPEGCFFYNHKKNKWIGCPVLFQLQLNELCN
jgi:hypothetical protein